MAVLVSGFLTGLFMSEIASEWPPPGFWIRLRIAVADANKIMPAKSTWFEPKVRCGLFLHELD